MRPDNSPSISQNDHRLLLVIRTIIESGEIATVALAAARHNGQDAKVTQQRFRALSNRGLLDLKGAAGGIAAELTDDGLALSLQSYGEIERTRKTAREGLLGVRTAKMMDDRRRDAARPAPTIVEPAPTDDEFFPGNVHRPRSIPVYLGKTALGTPIFGEPPTIGAPAGKPTVKPVAGKARKSPKSNAKTRKENKTVNERRFMTPEKIAAQMAAEEAKQAAKNAAKNVKNAEKRATRPASPETVTAKPATKPAAVPCDVLSSSRLAALLGISLERVINLMDAGRVLFKKDPLNDRRTVRIEDAMALKTELDAERDSLAGMLNLSQVAKRLGTNKNMVARIIDRLGIPCYKTNSGYYVSPDDVPKIEDALHPSEPAKEPEPTAEPAKPVVFLVEPIEPANPVEIIEPVEPAESIESIEPAEPVESIEPAEPVEPIEPANPVEIIEPADVAEPTPTADDESPESPALPPPGFLNTRQAADVLGINKRQMVRLASKIPSEMRKDGYMFRVEDVAKLKEERDEEEVKALVELKTKEAKAEALEAARKKRADAVRKAKAAKAAARKKREEAHKIDVMKREQELSPNGIALPEEVVASASAASSACVIDGKSYVASSTIASLIGISDKTVADYCEKGAPFVARTDREHHRGEYRVINVDDFVDWLMAHGSDKVREKIAAHMAVFKARAFDGETVPPPAAEYIEPEPGEYKTPASWGSSRITSIGVERARAGLHINGLAINTGERCAACVFCRYTPPAMLCSNINTPREMARELNLGWPACSAFQLSAHTARVRLSAKHIREEELNAAEPKRRDVLNGLKPGDKAKLTKWFNDLSRFSVRAIRNVLNGLHPSGRAVHPDLYPDGKARYCGSCGDCSKKEAGMSRHSPFACSRDGSAGEPLRLGHRWFACSAWSPAAPAAPAESIPATFDEMTE